MDPTDPEERETVVLPPVRSRDLPPREPAPPTGRTRRLLTYNRYKSPEERIYLAIFWSGILLLVLWIEICLGLAVWRVLGSHT